MTDLAIHTDIPPTIHKAVLSIAGATPESKQLVEELLEKDRQIHHCFWGRVGFHNHLSHHLLAAYDIGASPQLLQAIYDAEQEGLSHVFSKGRKDAPIERQDVKLTRENWKQYVGKDEFYANFVQYYAEEIKRLGAVATFEYYVFSEEANKDEGFMVERFVGGALHPMIQMGYAIEFHSDAMVAQALAQCAVHDAFEPSLFPWNPAPTSTEATSTDYNPSQNSNSIAKPNGISHADRPIATHPSPNLSDVNARHSSNGHPLLHLLRNFYASDTLTPVLPYDPDALLSQRRKDAFTPRRIHELRKICAQWHPALAPESFSPTVSQSDPVQSLELTENDAAEMLEQLAFVATLLFAGTSKPNRKPRLDFFIMHALTSSLFVEPLFGVLKEGRSRRMLLAAYLPVVLGYAVTRGRPRVGCDLIMSYSANPAPRSQHETDGAPVNGINEGLPGALGNLSSREFGNAWSRMLPHVLPARDSHTVKVWRALYVYAQRWGSVQPGSIIGAFDNTSTPSTDGVPVETIPGAGKLDGSIFVRAAGVLLDTMGWVGPRELGGGEKEGNWDRSGLGWDDAWKDEQ